MYIDKLFSVTTQGFVGVTNEGDIIKVSKCMDFSIDHEIEIYKKLLELDEKLNGFFPRLKRCEKIDDIFCIEAWTTKAEIKLNPKYDVKSRREKCKRVYIPIGAKALIIENMKNCESLYHFLDVKSRQQIVAVLKQTVYALQMAHEQIGFVHGDLHGENILIKKTDKTEKTFIIGGKSYNVETLGYTPCFIDFGHSHVNGMTDICHPMSYEQSSVILRKTLQEDFRFIFNHIAEHENPYTSKFKNSIGREAEYDGVRMLSDLVLTPLIKSNEEHVISNGHCYSEIFSRFCSYPSFGINEVNSNLSRWINHNAKEKRNVITSLFKKFVEEWVKLDLIPLTDNILVSLFRDVVENMVSGGITNHVQLEDFMKDRTTFWFGNHVSMAVLDGVDQKKLFDSLTGIRGVLQIYAEKAYCDALIKCKTFIKGKNHGFKDLIKALDSTLQRP